MSNGGPPRPLELEARGEAGIIEFGHRYDRKIQGRSHCCLQLSNGWIHRDSMKGNRQAETPEIPNIRIFPFLIVIIIIHYALVAQRGCGISILEDVPTLTNI